MRRNRFVCGVIVVDEVEENRVFGKYALGFVVMMRLRYVRISALFILMKRRRINNDDVTVWDLFMHQL